MRFKPITSKYNFDKNILVKDYPKYLIEPLANWIKSVLGESDVWNIFNGYIDNNFLDKISLKLRERFPRDSSKFLSFVFEDPDRATNVLGICLQNFAFTTRARELETILSDGGSGYSVMINQNITSDYQRGVADLVERVPEAIQKAAKEALNDNEILREAWQYCYSRNPDYAKTVSKCVDFLEHLFKNKYFPADPKPVLTKFIKDFEKNPSRLSYKGDNLVIPKNKIFNLTKEFIPIRGHHTAGSGRNPTKEEAEFVLHYSIFIWSLYF